MAATYRLVMQVTRSGKFQKGLVKCWKVTLENICLCMDWCRAAERL